MLSESRLYPVRTGQDRGVVCGESSRPGAPGGQAACPDALSEVPPNGTRKGAGAPASLPGSEGPSESVLRDAPVPLSCILLGPFLPIRPLPTSTSCFTCGSGPAGGLITEAGGLALAPGDPPPTALPALEVGLSRPTLQAQGGSPILRGFLKAPAGKQLRCGRGGLVRRRRRHLCHSSHLGTCTGFGALPGVDTDTERVCISP